MNGDDMNRQSVSPDFISRRYDLAVIGAGPAGASAAIHAARAGASVILLEQSHFPRHKVCGEFVSHESLALLRTILGGDNRLISASPRIDNSRLFIDGRCIPLQIDPPAASIPRYSLDEALWKAALGLGIDCRDRTTVTAIENGRNTFLLHTSQATLHARAVINATGRWSRLPRTALQQAFSNQREKWVGLKAHFNETEAPQSVDLYFFAGGYCGVQPVSADRVNACAMVRADIANTLDQVFARHPDLAARVSRWKLATEPVTTAPLLFAPIQPVENGVLFAGDAAGFVDPFTGDGISLALHSGTLAAQSLQGFFAGTTALESALADYRQAYNSELLAIHHAAARFRRVLSLPRIARSPILHALKVPAIGRWAVSSTRGRSKAAHAEVTG